MTQTSTQTLTPYIIVRGASAAIGFYKKAFGAEETMRMADPTGRIGHAELSIGGELDQLIWIGVGLLVGGGLLAAAAALAITAGVRRRR